MAYYLTLVKIASLSNRLRVEQDVQAGPEGSACHAVGRGELHRHRHPCRWLTLQSVATAPRWFCATRYARA